jgi:hypothetical protein
MPSDQAERQLILLSAGIAARRLAVREYAGELMRQVDWARLAASMRARRLLGVLGPRLSELAQLAGGRVHDDFDAALEQELESERKRGLYLQLVCQRLLAMLADAGIPSAALKGPQLSEAIYGDPGRRVSSDIDLLVPPEQLQAAAEVVRALGYGAPADHLGPDGLPLLHLTLAHEGGQLPAVEVHWRIHWYEDSFACERLLPPAATAAMGWRPAPADELAALLLFYARDGFVDLRLATDLSAWWDVNGAGFPDGAIGEIREVYPSLSCALTAASTAAERVVGLPASRLLGHARSAKARARVAARLANPNPRGSRSQLYADIGLIDGLLAPPGGLGAFIKRQLLPPPEVLDQQARHGARRQARSRVARCLGVLGRYALTSTRLLRAPETIP